MVHELKDILDTLVIDLSETADESDHDFVIDLASRALGQLSRLDLDNPSQLIKGIGIATKTIDDITKYKDIAFADDSSSDDSWANDLFVDQNALEEMAAIASEFDRSGDKMLQKQAAVLDEILLTIGASKRHVANAKAAQDLEVAKIKAIAAKDQPDDLYGFAKKEHDRQIGREEAVKAIDDKVKRFRPLEAPLKTRTCPDHPGAQVARVAEDTWQCSLDKGLYNYESGFTTMNGHVVPGGSIMNQTIAFDRPSEFVSFDTRESRLNS